MMHSRRIKAASFALISIASLSSLHCSRSSEDESGSGHGQAAPSVADEAKGNAAAPGSVQAERTGGDTSRAATSPRDKTDPQRAAEQSKAVGAPSEATASKARPSQPSSAKGSSSGALEPSFEIRRLTVTHAIEDREPVEAEQLLAGQSVLAFFDAKNTTDQPETVQVVFEDSTGTRVGFVKLEVPANSPRWRTWARTQHVKSAGAWRAIVQSEDGERLAQQDFVITAGPSLEARAAAQTKLPAGLAAAPVGPEGEPAIGATAAGDEG